MADQRIDEIDLDERSFGLRSPEADHERKLAILELLEDNHFAPEGLPSGPYRLHLGLEESRLTLDITARPDGRNKRVQLAMSPFRKIIREYFVICDSYYTAVRTAAPAQIEAIDMGRRALHNEGAALLRERLADKVDMDADTARRLFTLICVLHLRV